MRTLFFLFLFGLSTSEAATRVITAETDLAWVVKQIGGDLVSVEPLLSGSENPHYAESVPDYVRKVADAAIVCIAGLDLEVGWMPKVLARSGNGKVQPGGAGYCEMGRAVKILDKPTGPIDRSMGDVHPAGNPHFWLSPLALVDSSAEVLSALVRADPTNRLKYEAAHKEFAAKMKSFYEAQKRKFPKGISTNVLEYHKEFTYFIQAYGLNSLGSVEEKPGIAPSAGRLAEIASLARKQGVTLMLAADYSPKRTVEKFEELSGIRALRLPTSAPAGNLDYFAFHAKMVDAVVKGLADAAAQPKAAL